MAQQPPAPPPPPALGPQAQRPPAVTAAAVLLFVIGGIRALFGLLVLAALLSIAGDSDINGGLYALAILLTVLTLVAAGLQIAGGVGCLRTSQRGRSVALAGTVLGGGTRLLDLVVSASLDLSIGGAATFIAILLIASDIIIIVTLLQNKDAFTR